MGGFINMGYNYQLNIKNLLEWAVEWAPDQEIVYRDLFRYTYKDMYQRVKKLASVYKKFGVEKGDVIAVMDWDSHRYLENYFAVPMMGAILHTVNIRLSPEQIVYTINHAEDKILLVHKDFIPLVEKIHNLLETVKGFIIIKDKKDEKVEHNLPNVLGEYEELLESEDEEFQFEDIPEDTIATLFYTTGTTGNPKGVYFKHRQLVLHTLVLGWFISAYGNPVSFTYTDVYMPLTPMFHVHAWGVPYIATVLGVKQVYPGRYEPEMLLKLVLTEKVTFSHCVPSILHMIVTNEKVKQFDLSNWKVIIGGSALPKGLAKAAYDLGIKVTSGYGMSETCPVLTIASFKPKFLDATDDQKIDLCTKTGFPVPLVKLRIVDENMQDVPQGKVGEIVVRTPWLTSGYYKSEEKSKELWRGGWLHTGDIAYRDEEGYVKITDRLKDVIKSGGEWISSLELESLISQHEAVSEVAVIGVPDEKWGERPVAFVVLKENFKDKIKEEDLREFMTRFAEAGKIEKWYIPDKFIFVDSIPKTSVGKIDKKVLRAQYQF